MSLIRNFCIIAHIDHGKSTLADRLLDITGTISNKTNKINYLMIWIWRGSGITIKSHAIQMKYEQMAKHIPEHIDTPGHVDFSYEVSNLLPLVKVLY